MHASHIASSDIHAFLTSELFADIQMAELFSDSKLFADATLKAPFSDINSAYQAEKLSETFDLAQFILRFFTLPAPLIDALNTDYDAPPHLLSHIQTMWQQLRRSPDKNEANSLLPLPNAYLVPGGRFREIYYWDSYFSALGLAQDGHESLVLSMTKNFLHLQNSQLCIPNGNRLYYVSRSQPPVLALMVSLICENKWTNDDHTFLEQALPMLEKEHAFWMRGESTLKSGAATSEKRVVKMPDGSILNRYWDELATPRPESYEEDIALAAGKTPADAAAFYRHIRAACESGWDFSTRWLTSPDALDSINTTNIVPIDLNCLLWNLENTLHKLYTGKDSIKANHFKTRADNRADAINRFCWNSQSAFYFDYNIQTHTQSTVASLAATLPLFFKLASRAQAKSVLATLKRDFLETGGLVTTTQLSHQQWDSPNGWAPLQWFAVIGAEQYDDRSFAKEVMSRWVHTVDAFFQQHHTIMEKYNVVTPDIAASGGEYEVQSGFGWTNGVTRMFIAKLQDYE
ncbi:trehalase family glycosidase [Aestuariibacter sp. AA17]|uniref:Trehalase family glycosidase n=1 Tax=Fluctibacter corallii TaxID=2984329 RepID=A0ABT3A463_9ALTE|nr:trehalase family glycosidase [Aestuariibacter sp. AA17]MCV2883448.1 trehalase family glycosidase [Aestuariibacter sp. AA17]